MRIGAAASREELLLEWARAEWQSPRFGRWFPQREDCIARLADPSPFDAARPLDTEIVRIMAWARGRLLQEVDLGALQVHQAVLEDGELGGLRLFRDPELDRLARGGCCLADLLEAIEAIGDDAELPLAQSYLRLRKCFDPARMQGRPILLAAADTAPPLLLEGYCRLLLLLARQRAGNGAAEYPVILAIWPGLPNWRRYRA